MNKLPDNAREHLAPFYAPLDTLDAPDVGSDELQIAASAFVRLCESELAAYPETVEYGKSFIDDTSYAALTRERSFEDGSELVATVTKKPEDEPSFRNNTPYSMSISARHLRDSNNSYVDHADFYSENVRYWIDGDRVKKKAEDVGGMIMRLTGAADEAEAANPENPEVGQDVLFAELGKTLKDEKTRRELGYDDAIFVEPSEVESLNELLQKLAPPAKNS